MRQFDATQNMVTITSYAESSAKEVRCSQSLRPLHGQTVRRRDIRPSTSMTRKTMTNRKKRSFAIPAAAEAIPPKPNTAATSAMIKKTTAQYNIQSPPFEICPITYVQSLYSDLYQFDTHRPASSPRLKYFSCFCMYQPARCYVRGRTA